MFANPTGLTVLLPFLTKNLLFLNSTTLSLAEFLLFTLCSVQTGFPPFKREKRKERKFCKRQSAWGSTLLCLGRRYDIRTRSKRWKTSLFCVVSLDIRQYACDFTPWKVKIFQTLLSSKNFFRVNFSQYKEKTQLILSYLRVFWRSNTGNSPKKTGSDIATSA